MLLHFEYKSTAIAFTVSEIVVARWNADVERHKILMETVPIKQ